MLRLLDSFTRRKVDFVPREPGKVGMYLCGPTVQNSPHVGHGRSAIAFDIVRRYLTWSGFEVRFVRNVTDIDDKIIVRARECGEEVGAFASRYADEYNSAMAALGVRPPDVEPRVTGHIPEIVALIERLVARGVAYAASGDVYYSVNSFAAYGRLSGQSIDDLRAGARVELGELKQNPLDFALWKAAKPGEPSWSSPWGPGRPGWHIECSAMALAHLGETFDLHVGGKDLAFPHHENEIAQSVGALGEGTFARHWMHNGFVNFNDEKMSKSLGNVFLIRDLLERFDGETLRFFLLGTHYRSPISFEVFEQDGRAIFPGLDEADRRLEYFYGTLARLDAFLGEKREVSPGPVTAGADRLDPAVRAAMDDDFNTAVAVAELGEAARAANKLLDDPAGVPKDVRRRSLARLAHDLRETAVGALGLLDRPPREFLHARRARLADARGIVEADVAERLTEREAARGAREFARADELRDALRAQGIEIMDTSAGPDWRIADA